MAGSGFEIPIGGKPVHSTAILTGQMCRDTLPHLTVHDVGAGLHFLPEDRPAEIGDALSSWLRARLDR